MVKPEKWSHDRFGRVFFLLTSRVFCFKIGEKTRSFSLAQEVRMVWILIVKKNLIISGSLKLFFHLLNESCMDNIKKNWRWNILHFYFFWLQSHAVFCDKSRCKRNYKNASTELFSRKSFYFFFHNEVKKKTLSLLDLFSKQIKKAFCKFSFGIIFLHFKCLVHPAVHRRWIYEKASIFDEKNDEIKIKQFA